MAPVSANTEEQPRGQHQLSLAKLQQMSVSLLAQDGKLVPLLACLAFQLATPKPQRTFLSLNGSHFTVLHVHLIHQRGKFGKIAGEDWHGNTSPFYFGVKASGGWKTVTAEAVMPLWPKGFSH